MRSIKRTYSRHETYCLFGMHAKTLLGKEEGQEPDHVNEREGQSSTYFTNRGTSPIYQMVDDETWKITGDRVYPMHRGAAAHR